MLPVTLLPGFRTLALGNVGAPTTRIGLRPPGALTVGGAGQSPPPLDEQDDPPSEDEAVLQDESWPLALPNPKLLKLPAALPSSSKTIAIVPSEGTLRGTSLQSGEAVQSVPVAAHVDP